VIRHLFDFDIDTHYDLEEDEQLARALQESLNAESPPRQNVPVENVPRRRNVPIEDVPPQQYVPAKESPPHVYPASGYRCPFLPLFHEHTLHKII
jgi:hypothetical protein